MLHVRRIPYLALAFGLLTVVLAPQTARAACAHSIDPVAEQTLFTFNALLYAASSVATPSERAAMHQFLLDYEPNASLDAAYPVRPMVAEAVSRWPLALRQRILAFVLRHRAAATNYNALIVQLVGPAPAFRVYNQQVPGGPSEQAIFADRAALAELMHDAWAQGNLAGQWARARSMWAQSQLCSDHLATLRHNIASYTRIAAAPLAPTSKVLHNPLMPMGSGVTCVFADGHFVMLIGPTRSAREQDMLITHELLHPVLNTMFHNERRLRIALAETSCVFDHVARANPHSILTRFVYNTWESYLAETMVRSVSHRLTGVAEAGSAAFLIAPQVTKEMAYFEAHAGSFADATIHLTHSLQNDMCGHELRLSRASAKGQRAAHFSRQ